MRTYSGNKLRLVKDISYIEFDLCAKKGHSFNSAARILNTNSDRLRIFISENYPSLAQEYKQNGLARKSHQQASQQKYKNCKKTF